MQLHCVFLYCRMAGLIKMKLLNQPQIRGRNMAATVMLDEEPIVYTLLHDIPNKTTLSADSFYQIPTKYIKKMSEEFLITRIPTEIQHGLPTCFLIDNHEEIDVGVK